MIKAFRVIGLIEGVTTLALFLVSMPLKYMFSHPHLVQPLGMLRMIALISSFANIPAELVFCFATGNTARIRNLNCGLIEPGRAADFVFMDRAQHTAGATLLESVQLGDIPGIGMVMIDGLVRCGRSRNTPPATEIPVVI